MAAFLFMEGESRILLTQLQENWKLIDTRLGKLEQG